jgi:nitroimidazol reductase NimA-like FMN-containing flavoprotein (pyridoxamine 5'-phosphate oxidase superfamily)
MRTEPVTRLGPSALAPVSSAVDPEAVELESLEVLSRADCLALLATQELGRVGISSGALPAILPVNYALLEDDVVFRSAPGTKLSTALANAVVAFEVDHWEQDRSAGWSVLVVGRSAWIEDGSELEKAQRLALELWAPGTRDFFVRITSDRISGRRYRRPPA